MSARFWTIWPRTRARTARPASRSATITRAGWIRGDRGQGRRAAETLSRRDRCGERPGGAADAVRDAPATPPRSRSGRFPSLTRSDALHRGGRPGRAGHAARLLPAARAKVRRLSAPRTRRTSSRCRNWRASPSGRQGRRHLRARNRDGQGAMVARTEPRHRQAQRSADVAGLKAKAPEVDWALMLKTAGLDSSPPILMANNTALTAMGKIMVATPLSTWKDYLAFHFVSDHATFLPKAFDDAQFGFYSKTLSRRAGAARPLEARRPADQRRARRSGRQDLRREILSRRRAKPRWPS